MDERLDASKARQIASLILAVSALAAGGILSWQRRESLAQAVWASSAALLGLPHVFRTVRDALRARFATDMVASLSIVTGIALAQPAVSLIVILMLRGGELLERFAEGRASQAVRELESAAPRSAHRLQNDQVVDVRVDAVVPSDVLLIRPGEIVPCDGIVVTGESQLDTSTLTGEAAPVRVAAGLEVLSGTRNGFGSFQLRAIRPAAQSQYAQIVELVRAAQADKAPLQRLADRYATWFTPFTLLLCAATLLATRNWLNVLAVLAVATPCPLILATPIAIIGGINQAAKRSIIIKSGGALERLSAVSTIAFDKTGTLTLRSTRIAIVRTVPGFTTRELLGFSAAIESHSSHPLARVIVDAARAAGITARASSDHLETPGDGITGIASGERVHVGSRSYVMQHVADARDELRALNGNVGAMTAYVAIRGRLAGAFEFEDARRPEAPAVVAQLRHSGLDIRLLSGDDSPTVLAFASSLGIEDYYGDLKPSDKASLIEQWTRDGASVMMVGDGINDAVALTVADVGVAMAASGSTISSEAADVVLLTGALDAIPQMLSISKRTMRIAKQSIRVGIGLSAMGMTLAAFGLLAPMSGAVVQELIDVAVIVNAMRTAITTRQGRIS